MLDRQCPSPSKCCTFSWIFTVPAMDESMYTEDEFWLTMERSRKYQGTARINISQIALHPSVSQHLNQKNVERLCEILDKEGWRRFNIYNHVSAMVQQFQPGKWSVPSWKVQGLHEIQKGQYWKNMFRIMDPQPGHAIHHAALPHAGQIPICVWNRTAWEAFLRASWLLGLRLDPMVNDDGNPSGNASIASDTWHSHTVWCCLQSEVLCVTALARRAYPTILRLASFADAPTHLLGMSTE